MLLTALGIAFPLQQFAATSSWLAVNSIRDYERVLAGHRTQVETGEFSSHFSGSLLDHWMPGNRIGSDGRSVEIAAKKHWQESHARRSGVPGVVVQRFFQVARLSLMHARIIGYVGFGVVVQRVFSDEFARVDDAAQANGSDEALTHATSSGPRLGGNIAD